MDMGFSRAGFKIVWANDIDRDACETHRKWSSAEVVCSGIADISLSSIPQADVVIGGFPCQGFSLAGPRKINDSRNALYQYFVRVVEALQPEAFVAENVKGILTLGQGQVLSAIVDAFRENGYEVRAHLANAADYGVPQERWRVFLVGIKTSRPYSFAFPEKSPSRTTLGHALRSVPKPNEADICQAPYSSRYMSRNRRRDWSEVSYTIPAMAKQVPLHPSSPRMRKLGPDRWEFGKEGTTRRFSWQEAAAIQTFPIGMDFVGDLESKYRQIGNAVPVHLAEHVGRSLRKALTYPESSDTMNNRGDVDVAEHN